MIVEWAATVGLPAAVVRGVSDTAARGVPALFAEALDEHGRVRMGHASRMLLAPAPGARGGARATPGDGGGPQERGDGSAGPHAVRVIWTRSSPVARASSAPMSCASCSGRGDGARPRPPWSDRRALAGLPVEIAEGDLLDRASLRRAVAGVAEVYHVAADYRLWARRSRGDLSRQRRRHPRRSRGGRRRPGSTASCTPPAWARSALPKDGTPGTEDTPVRLDDMVGTTSARSSSPSRWRASWPAAARPWSS